MRNRAGEHITHLRPVWACLLLTGILVTWYWDLLFPLLVRNTEGFTGGNSLLPHLFSDLKALAAALIFLLPSTLLWWRQRERSGKRPLSIRIWLGIPAMIIACQLAGESYNYFLDSWLIVDRLMLVVLALTVFFHTAFVPLFLLAALVNYSPYFYPFDWLYTYDIRPVFNILITGYAVSLLPVRLYNRRIFFTAVLLMQAGSYFISGAAKVLISPDLISWFTGNELQLLPMGAALRGWDPALTLPFSSPFFRTATAIGVFLIEFLCLFAWSRRRIAIMLLPALSIMHVLIALTTGIVFWFWVAINLTLLFLLFRRPQFFIFPVRRRAFVSALAVAFAWAAYHPIFYAWHDSRYHWVVDLVAVDAHGRGYVLNKNKMGGYSYFFTHAEFQRLIDRPIGQNNGYSGPVGEVRQIRKAESPNALKQWLRTGGTNHYDPSYAEDIQHFLSVYFSNYNRRVDRSAVRTGLWPLRQLYMYRAEDGTPPDSGQIDEIQLVFREYFYDGNEFVPLDTTRILTAGADY